MNHRRLNPPLPPLGTLAWAGLALLAGCGAPGAPTPPLLRAAASQTRTGEEAYLTGHAAAAVPALKEAVRLHLAAGDVPGTARALLNLALAQRGAADVAGATATAAQLHELTPAARQQLEEQPGKSDASAELASASDWLDALLALDRGDPAAASASLASAQLKLPGASPWPGRLEELRAELALAEGRFPEAVTRARAAGAASAAAGDRAEQARAWRCAGAAHARLSLWADARTDYLAAIRIEESLGGGTRMAGDLTALAAVARSLGDGSSAELYERRARAIMTIHPPAAP